MSYSSRPKTMEDITDMDISLMDLEDLAQQIRTSTMDIKPEDLAERLDQINIEYHVNMVKAHYEEKRDAPQVHYRVNVQGQKRVPDATFTLEGDDRDIDVEEFWRRRDEFQREVDRRYPLEQQPHMVELPPAQEGVFDGTALDPTSPPQTG